LDAIVGLTRTIRRLTRRSLPFGFLARRLDRMLSDTSYSDVVGWGSAGTSFLVKVGICPRAHLPFLARSSLTRVSSLPLCSCLLPGHESVYNSNPPEPVQTLQLRLLRSTTQQVRLPQGSKSPSHSSLVLPSCSPNEDIRSDDSLSRFPSSAKRRVCSWRRRRRYLRTFVHRLLAADVIPLSLAFFSCSCSRSGSSSIPTSTETLATR
jgi:hypothetical protein